MVAHASRIVRKSAPRLARKQERQDFSSWIVRISRAPARATDASNDPSLRLHVTPLQWALIRLWRIPGLRRLLTAAVVRSLSDAQQADLRHAFAKRRSQ